MIDRMMHLAARVRPEARRPAQPPSVGHGRGGIWTFNTGMISNFYPAGSAVPGIQTEIPLNPGASGGPMFDRHGRVVGVVTAGIADAQAINFALRVDTVPKALSSVRAHCDCLVVRAPKGARIFVDGTWVGTGPEAVRIVEPGDHEVSAMVGGKRDKKKVRFPAVRRVTLSP
ncbi:MAG: trypsin-like peptidase domain-containing protein [Myxococcota bacterium]